MGRSFHGLLVIDKPRGITSRDAVNRAQSWFPPRTRLGHTGTLDPLATGVLVLCVGEATRLTEYVQRMAKTYRVRIQLGGRSDTDDAEGKIEPLELHEPPDRAQVSHALQDFVGEIDQVPPAFSAAKIAGRRAYDLARRGRDVALTPRRVRIYGIDLLGYEFPSLDLEVRCGGGTYIRSLARDLGERLGCGGYVLELRRTRVGPFDVGQAISPTADTATARAALRPMSEAVADLPAIRLADDRLRPLQQGQALPCPDAMINGSATGIAVLDLAGNLIAIAGLTGGNLWPDKVFTYRA